MKLHAIKHDLKTTLWCGPAALAAITGKPTSEIVAHAKRISGRRHIKGMSNWLLIKTAAALGVKLESKYFSDAIERKYGTKPTLARWCRENKALFANQPVIVNITGHYVTICGRTLIDNNHGVKPVSIKRAKFRRCRVHCAFVPVPLAAVAVPSVIDSEKAITKLFGPVPPAAPAPVRPVSVTEPSDRTVARRLARQFGMDIEMEDFSEHLQFQQPKMLWPAPEMQTPELDPHDGDHFVGDWRTCAERAREYARLSVNLSCLSEQ